MRLISSARAYAIASDWGSFNDSNDPGRCLYAFHYGDGRPVSVQHRADCLIYLRRILNQGGPGAMSVRSERALHSLIRFLANCPLRPDAPAMVPQQVQQQQAKHGPATARDMAAAEARRSDRDEARPYTVTLTCGDMFAHSAEEAARMFREGMQRDYAAWPLTFAVTHQDSGKLSYVEIPADDEAGA